jgi:hypothetical protein
MRLTSKDIKGLIQIEINWCLDNPDRDLNHDQQMGFVNGLRQAQTLIERFESIPDETGRYAPPMYYWQHDETGRVCATCIQPSEQWHQISKGQYEMSAGATQS